MTDARAGRCSYGRRTRLQDRADSDQSQARRQGAVVARPGPWSIGLGPAGRSGGRKDGGESVLTRIETVLPGRLPAAAIEATGRTLRMRPRAVVGHRCRQRPGPRRGGWARVGGISPGCCQRLGAARAPGPPRYAAVSATRIGWAAGPPRRPRPCRGLVRGHSAGRRRGSESAAAARPGPECRAGRARAGVVRLAAPVLRVWSGTADGGRPKE